LGIDIQLAAEAREQSVGGGQGPSQESPQTLVFYGDALQVREGFAIALRAIEGIATSQPIDFTFP
jgi:hypothetical protein